jgi:branched-chain amino acid transport system substrate-binding protein
LRHTDAANKRHARKARHNDKTEETHFMKRLFPRATLLPLALLAGVAFAQQPTGEPIKVGAVLSLTGPGAGLGGPERNGIQLAEKRINERGGIRGRPLKVIIEDDGSKPDIAKSKAESLIHGEKVVALLGPSLTASTGAVATVTNSMRLPHLCITGLGPPIELTYKSLFHMMPPQMLNAKAMLEYIAKGLKAKKLGVLHDSGYGQLVMTNILNHYKDYGIEIVATEKFEVGATDVSTQAAKVRAAEPDVVGVIATSPVPFRNARQVRITQPIVSAIGSSSYEYVKGMGEFADDIVFAEFIVSEDPLPHQKEFVELFKKEKGSLPKSYDAAGWDATNVLAQALEKAGPDAGPDAISAAIRATPFRGVVAQFNFAAPDMTGIELESYTYSKLVKGRYTRLTFKAGK